MNKKGLWKVPFRDSHFGEFAVTGLTGACIVLYRIKFKMASRLVGRALFWFLDTFGEREVERSSPAHGDWTETRGWNFRGRFYPYDKS